MEHADAGLRAVATLIDTALLFVVGHLIALGSTRNAFRREHTKQDWFRSS
jgi:hypothetical protein